MLSVAATLLQKGHSGLYDAIILAKRDISGRHFLVTVDCSIRTLNAVDHLGFMLQGDKEVDITLFHSCSLLADEHITPREIFYEKWGKGWCDKYLQGGEGGHFHFQATKQILKENNISAERIHCIYQQSGIEPSQMIIREMKKQTYSTITMGRRLDEEKYIFKGVSDRVLANIDNAALWVIV